MWIGALSPKKFSLGDDDILGTSLMKGQLVYMYSAIPEIHPTLVVSLSVVFVVYTPWSAS